MGWYSPFELEVHAQVHRKVIRFSLRQDRIVLVDLLLLDSSCASVLDLSASNLP